MEHVFTEKDLGVTFDADLTFDDHIHDKVKKANSIVGLIRRTFSYLDCSTFRKLYVAFVRPHLEYAQIVWSPHLRKHIDMIENVQIRATKLVDGLKELDYATRLQKLNMTTLVYRRSRGDLIEVFKHYHHYDMDVVSKRFQQLNCPSRQHDYQLSYHRPRDGLRGVQTNSFYFRTTRAWNLLPRHVAEAGSVDMFKKRLDSYWENEEMKFYPKALPPHKLMEHLIEEQYACEMKYL